MKQAQYLKPTIIDIIAQHVCFVRRQVESHTADFVIQAFCANHAGLKGVSQNTHHGDIAHVYNMS